MLCRGLWYLCDIVIVVWVIFVFFFFNDTANTEIYTYLHTLSLHDALPIYRLRQSAMAVEVSPGFKRKLIFVGAAGVGIDTGIFDDDQAHAAERPLAIEGDHLRCDFALQPAEFGRHGRHHPAVGQIGRAHV